MLALKIIGIIAAIIALIMLIPVGADIAYEGGRFTLSAKVCGVLLQLFPRPERDESAPKEDKKPKEEKKPEQEKAEGEQQEKPKKKLKLSFNKEEIFLLVKKVLMHFGRFGRKFRVDRFLLHYTAAGDDPYYTAVTFGDVNAALSALAPICAQRFDVKDCDVRTDIDFTKEEMELDFGLAFSIRIGAFFALGIGIVNSAIGILIKSKLRLLREKRAAVRKQANDGGNVIDIEIAKDTEEENNIQEEERID